MFSELCNPAKIYLVFTLISVILDIIAMFDNGSTDIYSFLVLGITIVFHYAWLMLLQYFCNREMEGIAWFILFLPFILVFLFFIFFGMSLTYIISQSNFNITTPTPFSTPFIQATRIPTTPVSTTRAA